MTEAIASLNFISLLRTHRRLPVTSPSETICALTRKWLGHMNKKSGAPVTSTLMTHTLTPMRKMRGFDALKPERLFGSQTNGPMSRIHELAPIDFCARGKRHRPHSI